MNQVKGEGFVSLPDDHVLRRDIDWVQYKTGTWQQVHGLDEMKWTVARASESGYSNACCHFLDYPASEKTEEASEDAVAEGDASAGNGSEPFQMQVGWCETVSGDRRNALVRVPDSIARLLYPWIVIDEDGAVYTHMDDGRWSDIGVTPEKIAKHLPYCTGWDWRTAIRSKTPQVGEWWRNLQDGTVVHISGMSTQGEPIWESSRGQYYAASEWPGWQHEPECTGFDWRPQP